MEYQSDGLIPMDKRLLDMLDAQQANTVSAYPTVSDISFVASANAEAIIVILPYYSTKK